MSDSKLALAAEYERKAVALRKEAFEERSLPRYWKVGDKVRFLETVDFGPSEGTVLTILSFDKDYVGEKRRKADEYQVFYTGTPGRPERFWTTPHMVELVKE